MAVLKRKAPAKPVILLGAGASIDAGLLDSYKLTEEVYNRLISTNATEAELFSFVIAKLIVRNTRQGKSPFDLIDIESAYDALKRLIYKDNDILSEFVSGWDILTAKPVPQPPEFSTFDFERTIKGAFSVSSSRSLTGSSSIRADTGAIRNLAHMLSRQFRRPREYTPNLSIFTETLASCLKTGSKDHAYIRAIVRNLATGRADCIATLNYDLLIEDSCDLEDVQYDYGLKSWNLRRYVKFQEDSLKILKLHGSLNWYFDQYDGINTYEEERKAQDRRALVFGGQADKLEVNGPYLALRHEFFRRMRQTNILLIAGYSFRDLHINSLINSWLLTKKNGKLIIVSPSLNDNAYASMINSYKIVQGAIKRAVQVKIFKDGLANCYSEALEESVKHPSLGESDFTEQDFRFYSEKIYGRMNARRRVQIAPTRL